MIALHEDRLQMIDFKMICLEITTYAKTMVTICKSFPAQIMMFSIKYFCSKFDLSFGMLYCVKIVCGQIRSFFWCVFSRTQLEYGLEKTLYLTTFHAWYE